MKMHRCLCSVAFALLLAVTALMGAGAPGATAQDAVVYFVPETSQWIAEPTLTAWIDLGGPDRLGMPVSSAATMGDITTQYFELGVLRISNDDTVEVVPAGRELLNRPDPGAPLRTNRRSPAPPETRAFTALARSPSSATVVYDETTGHAVKGSMLTAHDELGGAERLGAPLSEAYRDGDARVQWFEMGRLEQRRGDVALGAVGTRLAMLDGADIRPKRQGSLATLDLPTFLAGRDAGNLAGGVDSAGSSFAPARISIPAIGVDASIESIGIVDNVMQVPSNPWNVGWYSGLGGPGGNTVMAGHKDWAGVGPVVFYALGALGAGNEIFLYDGAGNAATYIVYESYTVDAYADAGSIVGDKGGDTLTLITCGGDFSGGMYNLRVIVHASRAA